MNVPSAPEFTPANPVGSSVAPLTGAPLNASTTRPAIDHCVDGTTGAGGVGVGVGVGVGAGLDESLPQATTSNRQVTAGSRRRMYGIGLAREEAPQILRQDADPVLYDCLCRSTQQDGSQGAP